MFFSRFSLVSIATNVVSLLLVALPAIGQSNYNEIASIWLLNPVTSNWTCQVDPQLPPVKSGTGPGACYATQPSQYGFAYVRSVPVVKSVNGALVNKMYFYTEMFGESAGPGSECFGDSIVLFETPYTHDGVRGSGVIYRGTVRPCDQQFYAVGSAFKDPSSDIIYVTAGLDTETEAAANVHHKIVYASSKPSGGADDGIHFSNWSTLIAVDTTSLPNLNITELQVAIHPQRANNWFGFMSFFPSTASFFGTTPVLIDWNTNTFQYLTGPTTWTSVPIGGLISQMPYPTIPTRANNLTYVASHARWELWVEGLPSGEGVKRSGVPPCGFPANPQPTATYNRNMSSDGGLDNGSAISFYVVTPVVSTFFSPTGPFALLSDGPNGVQDYGSPGSDDIRPNPADYSVAFDFPNRTDLPDGTWGLYTGSLDATICNNVLGPSDPWSGSGILFTRLENHN